MSDWKTVCAASDVGANEIKKFTVDGTDVVVANYGDGYRVFPPFCPHMLEPLHVSGLLDGGVLTCSKHLWQWDLTSGEKKGLSEKDILLYDCKVEGDNLVADMAEVLSYDWEEEDELDDDDFFN